MFSSSRRRLVSAVVPVLVALLVSAGPAGASVAWPPTGPSNHGWTLNGSAAWTGGAIGLTSAGGVSQAGSAFYGTPQMSAGFHIQFFLNMGATGGADGITFVMADADQTPPTTLGAANGGLGFTNTPGLVDGVQGGIGVAFVTHQDQGDPSNNFVGVLTGGSGSQKDWLDTSEVPFPLYGLHLVDVTYDHGELTVGLDGANVLVLTVTLPSSVRVGFTSSNNASSTGDHQVTICNCTSEDQLSAGGALGLLTMGALGAGIFAVGMWSARRRHRRSITLA